MTRAFPELSPEQEEQLKAEGRKRSQEDLHYLAKYVLGYNKITDHYHKKMAYDIDTPNYKFKLLLHPRGHYKSTLGTESRAIHTLINDPNERILITNAKLDNSRKFLRAISRHFNQNHKFRWMWRDYWISQYMDEETRKYSDDKNIDWVLRDTQDEFILLRPGNPREASITTGAVDASMVSQHYCLFSGSKVLTSKGFLPVEQVEEGHRILTKEGKFKPVEAVSKTKSSGKKVRVKPAYTSEVTELTDNHRVLVYRGDAFVWVEAGELTKDDRLVVPKMQGKSGAPSKTNDRLNRLYRTPDIWRLLGYWVGDGCRTPDGDQIRIVQGKHEWEHIEDIVNIVETHLERDVSVRPTKSSTYMICFADPDFKTLTKAFGEYAYNKKIPVWALSNYNSKQIELIKGYFRADGCLSGNTVSFSSTSLDLLAGLQLLLAQMEIPSTISKGTNGGEMQIFDYVSDTRQDWVLNSTHPMLKLLLEVNSASFPKKPFRSFFTDKYWVTGIDKLEVEDFEDEYVYDLQVKDDESFYCPGMIVHNSHIIADDLINREFVTTPEQVEKSVLYFKDLLDLLDPDGKLEIIGTRWAHHDLYSWIINEFGHKASLRVPEGYLDDSLIQRSEKTPEEDKEWMVSIQPCFDENNQPIFPEEFDIKTLNNLRASKGPYEFGSQYLLNPTPKEDQKFHDEWFRVVDFLPDPKNLTVCITVDPAISLDDEACRSACVVCGYDESNNMYLMDGFNERLGVEEFQDCMFELVEYWQSKAGVLLPVGFESIGFQEAYVYNLERKMLEKGTYFAIEEIKRRTKSKDERILRLVPRIKHGFHIPRTILKQSYTGREGEYDLVQRVKWQLTKFPYAGEKDLADTLADQIEIVKPTALPGATVATENPDKNREFVHRSIKEDRSSLNKIVYFDDAVR